MTITVATCDGCDVRFRHADEAFVIGIQPPGEKEFVFHVCMPCASKLADNDQVLDARVMATARKRLHGRGVLVA